MIPVGALVTLLVEKSFPGLDTINAGISGMVVGHTRAASGLLHIVDFGPEGQWNCVEAELRQESGMRQEDPDDRYPEDDDDEDSSDDEENEDDNDDQDPERAGEEAAHAAMDRLFAVRPGTGRVSPEPVQEEPKKQHLSSFEEDLARMEASKKRK